MFALFGKVYTMVSELKFSSFSEFWIKQALKRYSSQTEQLQSLRPPNTTAMTSTIPPYLNYCVDVSVNCTLLEEFRYNETVKQTSEILSFLTTTALITKYNPNATLDLGPFSSAWNPDSENGSSIDIAGRFNQKGKQNG